jgi:preprotein translocase subunit SecD
MFAELDDRTPPVPGAEIHRRVDERVVALRRRDARRHRRVRGAFAIAAVALIAAISFAVVGTRSRSVVGPASGGAAPTTTGSDITGPVIVEWRFAGHPTVAAQDETAARLDRRFRDLGLPVRAVPYQGGLVIRSTGQVPPSVDRLESVAVPGRLEMRPVFAVLGPGVTTTTTVPTVVRPMYAPPGAKGIWPSFQLGPVVVDNAAVESATADLSPAGEWQVRPLLRSGAQGIALFDAVAAKCFAKDASCPTGQLALLLDGAVLSAPNIDAPSFERDQITIETAWGPEDAQRVAAILSTGPLPAPLVLH